MNLDEADAKLASLVKRLAALSDDELWKNHNVVVDIKLPIAVVNGAGNAAFGSQTIDNGWEFYCVGPPSAHYSASGVLAIDGTTPATLAIPESMRPDMFDFTWNVRDNTMGRDWCNLPMPSSVLSTGNMGFRRFNGQDGTELRARAKMRGGTRIDVTINPIFFNPASFTSGLQTIVTHKLQFIFSGVYVKEGVL
jgi:hypothetical protein